MLENVRMGVWHAMEEIVQLLCFMGVRDLAGGTDWWRCVLSGRGGTTEVGSNHFYIISSHAPQQRNR